MISVLSADGLILFIWMVSCLCDVEVLDKWVQSFGSNVGGLYEVEDFLCRGLCGVDGFLCGTLGDET